MSNKENNINDYSKNSSLENQQEIQTVNNNQTFSSENNNQVNSDFQNQYYDVSYYQQPVSNQSNSISFQQDLSQANQGIDFQINDYYLNQHSNNQSDETHTNQNYLQSESLASNVEQHSITKKKSVSDRDNSKWIFPKNFEKISANDFKNLSPREKKEYENIKNSARKIGYVIEKRSLMRFYRVSLLDFIPFYIGQLISFIKFIIGFGDIVHSINFDKKSVWDFKSNFIIGMVFSLVIWPIVLICLTIVYPYIVLDSSSVTYAWTKLSDQLNMNGIQALGAGLNAYIQGAVVPLFHGSTLIITIIVCLVVSMLNVDTFLFKGLLNINRKVIFKIQRESVRDEIEKIRVQKPLVNKNT